MPDRGEVAVWVVAGCLFEITLPEAGPEWRFEGPRPEVTLLADVAGGGERRFRFRAEAAGAEAGCVELRFSAAGRSLAVPVRVAPEADLLP